LAAAGCGGGGRLGGGSPRLHLVIIFLTAD
jgi:hypothetical protein